MDATTFMMAAATAGGAWLVALLRKRNWSDDWVRLVVVLVSAACFLAGYLMDGKLFVIPMPSEFWTGLLATFGGQQIGYFAWKKVAPGALQNVERIGE